MSLSFDQILHSFGLKKENIKHSEEFVPFGYFDEFESSLFNNGNIKLCTSCQDNNKHPECFGFKPEKLCIEMWLGMSGFTLYIHGNCINCGYKDCKSIMINTDKNDPFIFLKYLKGEK